MYTQQEWVQRVYACNDGKFVISKTGGGDKNKKNVDTSLEL
jgi:hypothetical protein